MQFNMGDLMLRKSNFLSGVSGHISNVILSHKGIHDHETENLVKMVLEQNDKQKVISPNTGIDKLHQEHIQAFEEGINGLKPGSRLSLNNTESDSFISATRESHQQNLTLIWSSMYPGVCLYQEIWTLSCCLIAAC
jgi:VIT1/CCC1 family predicted Fe2+/Mn2+ transporter